MLSILMSIKVDQRNGQEAGDIACLTIYDRPVYHLAGADVSTDSLTSYI